MADAADAGRCRELNSRFNELHERRHVHVVVLARRLMHAGCADKETNQQRHDRDAGKCVPCQACQLWVTGDRASSSRGEPRRWEALQAHGLESSQNSVRGRCGRRGAATVASPMAGGQADLQASIHKI